MEKIKDFCILGLDSRAYIKKWFSSHPEEMQDLSYLSLQDFDSESCCCIEGFSPLQYLLSDDAKKDLEEHEMSLKNVVLSFLVCLKSPASDLSDSEIPVVLEYSYNPKANFNNLYFTSIRHDGSLLFGLTAANDAFQNTLNFLPDFPEKKLLFEEQSSDKKIKVEYGDIVIVDKTINDRPEIEEQMHQILYTGIPLSYKVVKKDGTEVV